MSSAPDSRLSRYAEISRERVGELLKSEYVDAPTALIKDVYDEWLSACAPESEIPLGHSFRRLRDGMSGYAAALDRPSFGSLQHKLAGTAAISASEATTLLALLFATWETPFSASPKEIAEVVRQRRDSAVDRADAVVQAMRVQLRRRLSSATGSGDLPVEEVSSFLIEPLTGYSPVTFFRKICDGDLWTPQNASQSSMLTIYVDDELLFGRGNKASVLDGVADNLKQLVCGEPHAAVLYIFEPTQATSQSSRQLAERFLLLSELRALFLQLRFKVSSSTWDVASSRVFVSLKESVAHEIDPLFSSRSVLAQANAELQNVPSKHYGALAVVNDPGLVNAEPSKCEVKFFAYTKEDIPRIVPMKDSGDRVTGVLAMAVACQASKQSGDTGAVKARQFLEEMGWVIMSAKEYLEWTPSQASTVRHGLSQLRQLTGAA
jgi:hypothetical protein